jgi:hypothetical protein
MIEAITHACIGASFSLMVALGGTVHAHAADLGLAPHVGALPSCYAGYVQQGYTWFWAHVPIACKVPGGTIVTGPGQNPGCGGAPGLYPCPLPRYFPDEDVQ